MNLIHLLDDAKCFEVVRAHRWPEGVRCPHCHADQITKQGRDEHQRVRQRYRYLGCQQKFDDVSERHWVLGWFLAVIGVSTHVGMVAHPWRWIFRREGKFVQVVLEDRFHAAITERL